MNNLKLYIPSDIFSDDGIASLTDFEFRLLLGLSFLADDKNKVVLSPDWIATQIWWKNMLPSGSLNVIEAIDNLCSKGLACKEGTPTKQYLKLNLKFRRFDNTSVVTEPIKDEISEDRMKDIVEVFNFWQEHVWKSDPPPKLTEARKEKIIARLKDFSVIDLKKAIVGVTKDAFIMGTDPNSKPGGYRGLESIFRNLERVERHIQMAGIKIGWNPEDEIKISNITKADVPAEYKSALDKLFSNIIKK